MFPNYEIEPSYGASYPQQRPSQFVTPNCNFEQFEINPFVNRLVSEFRDKADKSPNYFTDNNSSLLVYWVEDKVWYHCKVLKYNQYTQKFAL